MLDQRSPLANFINVFLEAKGFHGTSLLDYGRYLREFDRYTGETALKEALTLDRATQWVQEVKRRGPFAARNAARYLMSFSRWLADTRYHYGHEYRSVLERLPVPKTPSSNRQAFTPAELDEVWAALEQRPNEDRYRAIAFVRLLWAAGLRRGERSSSARSVITTKP